MLTFLFPWIRFAFSYLFGIYPSGKYFWVWVNYEHPVPEICYLRMQTHGSQFVLVAGSISKVGSYFQNKTVSVRNTNVVLGFGFVWRISYEKHKEKQVIIEMTFSMIFHEVSKSLLYYWLLSKLVNFYHSSFFSLTLKCINEGLLKCAPYIGKDYIDFGKLRNFILIDHLAFGFTLYLRIV